MNITSKPNENQLESVDLTISVTMPIACWNVVAEALMKGKGGYYGPAYNLHQAIEETVENYRARYSKDFTATK